ncbi:unnamed protein product [Dracunculus medinensis]|uniref:SCP domain-containing protein n=1 Tax=Dracunculus medinensis TaxID=318479 RepID=A0A0N4U8G3_DRAME|nr:unnamed protein product [Dracunculus medinensis]
MLLPVVFILLQIGVSVASKCPASKITEEMRSYVLKEHNKLRSQLANGEAEASNGLMPRSSNMHELEWDCGLEERAQQWAEYCDFEHSTQEFRNYSGENLYARWGYEEPKLGNCYFEIVRSLKFLLFQFCRIFFCVAICYYIGSKVFKIRHFFNRQ